MGPTRYDIVLVPAGFPEEELERFQNLCREFFELLQSEPWFDAQMGVLRGVRIDVPAEKTGFEATLPPGARQVVFDAPKLALFVDDQLASREWDLAILLIRGSQFGATASPSNHSVAVMVPDDRRSRISGKPLWFEYLMHELGHTAFGLADEYDFYESANESTPGDFYASMHSDITCPNVTDNPDWNQLKWLPLARLSEGQPHRVKNPNCSGCPSGPGPSLPIGMFEGGHYRPTGIFRPALTCRMRELGQPFCRVCVQAVHATLRRFHREPLLAAELPRISFGNLLINERWTTPLAVSNVGTGTVTDLQTEIISPNGGNSPFRIEPMPGANGLAEGEWRVINVTAGPFGTAGIQKGTLRIVWGTREQFLEIPLCVCFRNFTDV